MKRRSFIKTGGTAAIAVPLLHSIASLSCAKTSPGDAGHEFYLKLVKGLDEKIPLVSQRQIMESAHRWCGGVMDSYDIPSAGGTAYFIRTLATAYGAPESAYFGSDRLLEPLELATKYLLKAQHTDGTIDLHTTNFHSPPDTGFAVEHLCMGYDILSRQTVSLLEPIKANLRDFLLRAGDALTTGGIHTPNHRWVVCMALARLHAFFPNPKYLGRIEQWLGEKIDIDPDGQFTEKSASIYSPLTDRCLLTIARLLGRQELYEPVRRNLDMTLYYLQPDGEIVTAASTRQDQYQRGSMARYYYPYRYMALLDQNGRYAAMARLIEKSALPQLTEDLGFFLEDPTLITSLPADQPLPDNYNRVFKYSNLARIRRDKVSATILAKNNAFFSFHKDSAALEAIRFAAAFFGKGQFMGDDLQVLDGSYMLRRHLEGPYFQPLPVDLLPADGDWEKMERSKRPTSEVQILDYVVTVSETDGQFELILQITGTDHVPVAIELGFRKGGSLHGVQKVPGVEDAYTLGGGFGLYSYQGAQIRFGPGLAEHSWTQLRGALPKLNAQSVYLTGFTPLKISLTIA